MTELDLPNGDVSKVVELLNEYSEAQLSFERALGELHALFVSLGWDWFILSPKAAFNRRAGALLRAWSYERYCAERRAQLHDGSFPFWVFKAGDDCPITHLELDGIALPPTSEFWNHYGPPIDWECSCHVVGARTEASIDRMGGISGKRLPPWADPDVVSTSELGAIGAPWRGQRPSIARLLNSIARGEVDAPH